VGTYPLGQSMQYWGRSGPTRRYMENVSCCGFRDLILQREGEPFFVDMVIQGGEWIL